MILVFNEWNLNIKAKPHYYVYEKKNHEFVWEKSHLLMIACKQATNQ
jgi:hypothetical protein